MVEMERDTISLTFTIISSFLNEARHEIVPDIIFDAVAVKQGSFIIHIFNIPHDSRAAVWIVTGYSFPEFARQMHLMCHVT